MDKRLSVPLFLIISMVLAAPAMAAKTSVRVPTQALGTKPLKGTIKLDPKQFSFKKISPVPESPDTMDRAYEAFRMAHKAYIRARLTYRDRYLMCRTKSYSVQEQRQAGCRSTDTVAQCNRKLMYRCTYTARRYYSARMGIMSRKARDVQRLMLLMQRGYNP